MPRDIIPETKSDVLQVLEQGRARIEYAWIQRHPIRQMNNGQYAYCMMGSIYEMRQHDKMVCDEALVMLQQAVTALTDRTTSIINFNDYWGRRKPEIVQAFDVAIELQRRKEGYNGQ